MLPAGPIKEKQMKEDNIKLTTQNYVGLGIFWVILTIGIIGGVTGQKWAENIYTFLTVGLTFIFIFAVLTKTKFKPVKQFVSTYFIHVLFCVAMGWWWLSLYWCIILISVGAGIHYYIRATKGVVDSED